MMTESTAFFGSDQLPMFSDIGMAAPTFYILFNKMFLMGKTETINLFSDFFDSRMTIGTLRVGIFSIPLTKACGS